LTLRNILVIAICPLCLIVVALLSCRALPPRAVDYVSVAVANGECSVRHIQDIGDFKDANEGPPDTMPCTSVAGYLKDHMKLPVSNTVAVLIRDDQDPDTVRLIADLNGAGYKVSMVGIRRVVFPSRKNES
jgi:hypothetical protein